MLPILLLAGLVQQASATPYEAFPFDKQLPAVARLNVPYSFQISDATYASDEPVAYSAQNLPAWMSFDTQTLTFSGTPDTVNENAQFQLLGQDSSGQLSRTYHFVVTDKPAPQLSPDFSLSSLLSIYGTTNGNDGLVIAPSQIFNVTFDHNTFGGNSSLTYYGVSRQNHAPLPPWLFFDGMRFSGIAPVVNSAIAPEFEYDFALIASDFPGFSGTEVDFKLVVGAHQLSTSITNTLVINATQQISYDVPLKYVFLDSQQVAWSNISHMELVNAPQGLTLNNATITGSPSGNSNFSVVIFDVFQDKISLNFAVETTDSLFAVDNIGSVNATRGAWFQYEILESIFTDYASTTVNVKFPQWLDFNQSNMTLYGTVPLNLSSTTVTIGAEENGFSEKRSFQINGVDPVATTSQSSTSVSTSSTTSTNTAPLATTSSAPKLEPHKKSSRKTVAIACGVAIPVAVLLLLLILFLCLRRNKSKNKSAEAGQQKDSALHKFTPDEDFAEVPAALNAQRLDEQSYTSNSSVDEKNGTKDTFETYHDAVSSEGGLYYQNDNTRARKSWRDTKEVKEAPDVRQSMMTVNTVSTAELLNSDIRDSRDLAADPFKSSLPPRDSAFLPRDVSANYVAMDMLEEHSISTGGGQSSLSDDAYVPMHETRPVSGRASSYFKETEQVTIGRGNIIMGNTNDMGTEPEYL